MWTCRWCPVVNCRRIQGINNAPYGSLTEPLELDWRCIRPTYTTLLAVTNSAHLNTMSKDCNAGGRRRSGTNVEVQRDNLTTQTGNRRLLRSCGRTDNQRAAAEPYSSRTHINSASSTRRRNAPTQRIGRVVLGWRFKAIRAVPPDMQATPTLKGKIR